MRLRRKFTQLSALCSVSRLVFASAQVQENVTTGAANSSAIFTSDGSMPLASAKWASSSEASHRQADILPSTAYIPLVEVLTPSMLIRSYRVNKIVSPDIPPPPPWDAPTFSVPTPRSHQVSQAQGKSGMASSDSSSTWSKSASRTVAFWSDKNRELRTTKTISGILVDWSINECRVLQKEHSQKNPWVAFVPCSSRIGGDDNTGQRCSLDRQIRSARLSGAHGVIVYDSGRLALDQGTGSTASCGRELDAVLRGYPDFGALDILAPEADHEQSDNDDGGMVTPGSTKSGSDTTSDDGLRFEDGENGAQRGLGRGSFAFAAVRNLEAVRALLETLDENDDWIVVNVSMAVLSNRVKSGLPRQRGFPAGGSRADLEKPDPVYRADLDPRDFTLSADFGSIEGDHIKWDRESVDPMLGHAFNILTMFFGVFSSICFLHMCAHAFAGPILANGYVGFVVSHVPMLENLLHRSSQMTQPEDGNESNGEIEPLKRHVDRRVLESFEVKSYKKFAPFPPPSMPPSVSPTPSALPQSRVQSLGRSSTREGRAKSREAQDGRPMIPALKRTDVYAGSISHMSPHRSASVAISRESASKGWKSTTSEGGAVILAAMAGPIIVSGKNHQETTARTLAQQRHEGELGSLSDTSATAPTGTPPTTPSLSMEELAGSALPSAPTLPEIKLTTSHNYGSTTLRSFPGSVEGRPRLAPTLPNHQPSSAHRCFTAPPAPYSRRFPSSGPCPICLDEYEEGQAVRSLPCGHEYHTSCIDPWLLKVASYCPMCKTDYADWQIPNSCQLSSLSTSSFSSNEPRAPRGPSTPTSLSAFLSALFRPLVLRNNGATTNVVSANERFGQVVQLTQSGTNRIQEFGIGA